MRRRPSRLQVWRNRLATSRAAKNWQSFWNETNFPMAIGLFIVCATITYVWWRMAPQDPSNLWPEMGGMTLDVFFILIVFALFEHRRNKRQDIARQREVIDDYKRWDHPEAHLRIAGAIRRLNRLGVFALDMAGARLTKFEFARNGIESIEGSKFYDGRWGEKFGDSTIKMAEVSFDHLNCRNVTFASYSARHSGTALLLWETRGQSPWRSHQSEKRRRQPPSAAARQKTAPLHGAKQPDGVRAQLCASAHPARREARVPAGQLKNTAPSGARSAGQSASICLPAQSEPLLIVTRTGRDYRPGSQAE